MVRANWMAWLWVCVTGWRCAAHLSGAASLSMMIAFNIVCLILLAILAAWAGMRLGRSPGRWWIVGFALPLVVVVLTSVGLNFRQPEFYPPISWLLAGDNEWLVLTFCIPMMLGVLSARADLAAPGLARRPGRVLHLLSVVVVLRSGVLPALSPITTSTEQQNVITALDMDGVCLQSTPYNCGPAAAVTALHVVGIKGKEGGMGLLAKTNSVTGTDDWNLEQALMAEHGKDGLVVKRCYVDTVEELKEWPTAIAIIEFGFMVDHYVAVLGFEGEDIIIGDPLIGKVSMPVAEFDRKWRHVAILIKRDGRRPEVVP